MDILSINDLLDALEEHGADAVIKGTRKRPISSFALRDLYSNYADKPAYLLFLSRYPLIPSELAQSMVDDLKKNQSEIARHLAANPRTPQQSLHKLAKRDDSSVRLAVAQNPNASPKECQLLAQDQSAFVRAAIAENPGLPTYLQFILAEDSEPVVKIALAGRENLDTDVAHHLGRDQSALVKTALLQNKELEPELFQLWADMDDETLQSLILRNLDAYPASVRKSLRYSTRASVRFAALDTEPLSLPEMLWLAESDSIEDRVYLAQQKNLPSAIQRILAQDTSEKVRRLLAASVSLQQDIAERIAASHDLQACMALAKSPNISASLISELCLHPDPEVAKLVAYREDLTEKHWDLLINHREDSEVAKHIAFQAIDFPNIEEAVAERFAASRNPSLRAFAAAALELSPATLGILSQDLCDKVRESAVANPKLPEPQLRALCYDTNKAIANAAEKAIAQRMQPVSASTSSSEPRERFDRPTTLSSGSRRTILNKIVTFFKE
ncbi:hypothetical protein [Pelagicoccus sp. SDUM812003]|uniref:hypothetical protein n=1 Tax=Pelagicoccus sp. SDUM812003 TaxID=3041267 RepID=UPI00280FB837|nr:hypothetical protein [Pelagicoccus sp. SDUM812003]MDQ8203570.1 hypothetical protein [Pelagicoccus sp. SDUM812003]